MNGPILLIGGSGYIGGAFGRELERRGLEYRDVTRKDIAGGDFALVRKVIRESGATFLINCAGFTGKPNVDSCEVHKNETLMGNVVFPTTLAHACEVEGIRWGHVSSGCIYAGAWVLDANGGRQVVKDLMEPSIRSRIAKDPTILEGFAEDHAPNFCFADEPCSFYSGSKAMGEEAINEVGNCYVWRLRIPFDEVDNARNYLSKIQNYAKVYDNINSISHRADFVKMCLDTWRLDAPVGTYNVTNKGWVSTRDVVTRMISTMNLKREFDFWADDEEFYSVVAKTPRSNCVLDVGKLESVGVQVRSVEEALDDVMMNWVKADG